MRHGSAHRSAVADLNKFSDYGGPKLNGQITPGMIFRGMTPGDLNGPYLSQFLLKTIPMGAATLQNIRCGRRLPDQLS